MYFVDRAMEANYFNTEVFLWIDFGILRTDEWFETERYKRARNFTFSTNDFQVARFYD